MAKEIGIVKYTLNNNEWEDLDINNIPSDFFVNDRYEVMCGVHLNGDEWEYSECTRVEIVTKLLNGFIRYRYRLKPLEPIRITRGLEEILLQYDVYDDANNSWDGRKVEIID